MSYFLKLISPSDDFPFSVIFYGYHNLQSTKGKVFLILDMKAQREKR